MYNRKTYLLDTYDYQEQKMIQRTQEVKKMDSKSREYEYAMLDAFIKQTKMQSFLK